MMKIIGIGVIAFLFFGVQRYIYRRSWNKNLAVSIEFTSPGIFQGEEGELQEVVENHKRLPLPLLHVKFQTSRNLAFSDEVSSSTTDKFYHNDIFQVGGGEKITRTLTFTGKKRGYYKIDNIGLEGTDLFFTTQMTENRETDRYFYVYPKPLYTDEMRQSLRQLNGEVLVKRHWQEDPFEYRGIREYQSYDDIRNVNWKATAKTDELKVNQKNYTALQVIRIFFNIEDVGILKKQDAVEATLGIVVALAENFLGQGISVALYGNGADLISREPVVIEASAGKGQLERIYKALARVDTDRAAMSFVETFGEMLMQTKGSTQTIVVSPNCYDDFGELLQRYEATGQEYVWFYPVWESEEPQLPEWVVPHTRVLHLRDMS